MPPPLASQNHEFHPDESQPEIKSAAAAPFFRTLSRMAARKAALDYEHLHAVKDLVDHFFTPPSQFTNTVSGAASAPPPGAT
jgi:hypothetical protein